MKKGDFKKNLEKNNVGYKELKKQFGIRLKKGENFYSQTLHQVLKRLGKYKEELMAIISPKNLIENHESKMINSSIREEAYEVIKELSLLSWHIKKALLENEDEMIKEIKSALDYCQKEYTAMKKRLCSEMIKAWKKEESRDNYYIS